jgi:hypothetical protein
MDQTEIQNFITMLAGRKWLPMFILTIGWATRLLSDKSKLPYFNIPSRWQPVLVLVLAQVYSTANAVMVGVPVRGAIIQGFTVAFVTMGLFDLVVKAVFNDHPPQWLSALALVFDKPPSSPPTQSSPSAPGLTVEELRDVAPPSKSGEVQSAPAKKD